VTSPTPPARWRRPGVHARLRRVAGIGWCPDCRAAFRAHHRLLTRRETSRLVELVTTPVGPREARDAWSYPDFVDLRAADTGMAIAAWINGQMKTD
jgi:hypothetical protein